MIEVGEGWDKGGGLEGAVGGAVDVRWGGEMGGRERGEAGTGVVRRAREGGR